MMSEEVKQKKSKERKVEALPETFDDKRALQANGKPALCAFRPSCPTGSPGVFFVGFIRFWGFREPLGGVSSAVHSRGYFWTILWLILGFFWAPKRAILSASFDSGVVVAFDVMMRMI